MAITTGAAILGAGALGLGGALLGANAARSGANTAANASNQATAAQIAANREQYAQNREDFTPFRNLAPESLANLQASIYGRPIQFTTPTGETQTAQGQQFDLANFRPETTPAYEWQRSRTLEDLGNYFNLIGRGRGSTVQSNATARSLGDLNAAEYERGYNRLFNQRQNYMNDLLNLVRTAQGAAGSTVASGQAATGNITSALGQQGQTLANLANQQGQTQANLYAGIVPSAMNTVGTGLQLANYMNRGNQQNFFNNQMGAINNPPSPY